MDPTSRFGIITALDGGSYEVAQASGEAYTLADVYAVLEALPVKYRRNAAWLAELSTINATRQFATANNYHGFLTDLAGDTPRQLLGKPLYEASEMDPASGINAAATADNHILLIGDFSKYVIADRIGMSVEFIPHLFRNREQPPVRAAWMVLPLARRCRFRPRQGVSASSTWPRLPSRPTPEHGTGGTFPPVPVWGHVGNDFGPYRHGPEPVGSDTGQPDHARRIDLMAPRKKSTPKSSGLVRAAVPFHYAGPGRLVFVAEDSIFDDDDPVVLKHASLFVPVIATTEAAIANPGYVRTVTAPPDDDTPTDDDGDDDADAT